MNPSQLNDFLLKVLPKQLPVLVAGKPGVGKTAVATAAAAQLGYHLIVSHPAVADPTDFKGLPWVTDGRATFLPLGELEALTTATEPTLWLIDDLGQAPLAVQASLMQLIHSGSRQLGGHTLSSEVSILACTNRREDRAGVTGFLEPVKSRFMTIVELATDAAQWSGWAFANGIQPEIPAFLRWKPDLLSRFDASLGLEQSPSPRAWQHVSQLLELDLATEILLETVIGTVGEGAATELMAFLGTWRALPNPDLVIARPETAPVPEEPSVLFAACGALAHRATVTNVDPIFRYVARIPPEFQVAFVKFATAKDPKLANTGAYVAWAAANQEALQ